MSTINRLPRRYFLKTALTAGAASALGHGFIAGASAQTSQQVLSGSSRAALTTGPDHSDLIFQALRPLSRDIAAAIGKKRILIKPNNVMIDRPLTSTPVECLEGILEFLHSIGKREIVIAESAANGPTMEGFANYGYDRLAQKYKARLMDLDGQETERIYLVDQKDFRPHPLRIAKPMLDPENFIISAARFKTHDRVVATLSLKNIVVGAPIKDPGFRWGRENRPGAKNDKSITHGSGFHAVNYNLFALAPRLHPHLAVLDGFQGMEGNGPNSGTPVDQKVAIASLDWLAADRMAIELMGIDFAKVGYLNYCAAAGMGQADLGKIEILGEKISDHIRSYRLSDNIDRQLTWLTPLQTS